MSIVEYKETIDYTWVVARQLDRVAEAFSSIDYETPGPGVRRLYTAVRALYAISLIFIDDKELVSGLLRQASKSISEGRNVAALHIIEKVVHLILEGLDKKGLLVRSQPLLTGRYGDLDEGEDV